MVKSKLVTIRSDQLGWLEHWSVQVRSVFNERLGLFCFQWRYDISRYARWSYEEWYDEVLAFAASWSVHPADLNAVSESFFVASWR